MHKNIIIDQTLHGYSQGHHLLATSTQISKKSQRTMLLLSDLSGPEMHSGFSEYLTGYPLEDEEYYAFAKTWYAPENERPGCVWTHTFLIKFEDLKKIAHVNLLLRYFKRPQQDFDKDDYENPIEPYSGITNFNYDNSNKTTANELGNLIYSIYNDSKPIILPSESTNEYQELILLIWQNQWSRLRKGFSFCTGSLANRKLHDKPLDVQIVPYSLSKSIGRSNRDLIIFDDSQMKPSLSQYPEWVSLVADEILYQSNGKLKEFLEDFGTAFEGREHLSKLVQLYIETGARKRIKTIDKYLTATRTVFGRNESKIVIQNILEQLLNSFPNKWFMYTDFSSFLQDLSTTKGLSRVPCNRTQLKAQLEVLWESNNNKAKDLFKDLIAKDLNQFGELLLKKYSQLIHPEQLPVFTDMELGACNVLVGLNPKFALCSEIWQQPKDFQCEIIDCVDRESLNDALSQRIIETILENSSEVLYKQVFGVFGNISIKVFLDWCRKTSKQHRNKIEAWMKICRCSPKTCIKWTSSVEALDIDLLVSIVSILDPYSEAVCQYGIKPWFKLFEHFNKKGLGSRSQLVLAQFFLPLILMSDESVKQDFVEFSFSPVHDALARNKFSYEQWIKLEPLLPSVSWYNSWDKCKRLRKAMKKKGYYVQS